LADGTPLDVVTGAFSYTGRAIAEQLLAAGRRVRTLSRTSAPPGSPIEAVPYSFGDPQRLRCDLAGAEVLYNTYWIRFDRGALTFDHAVANTLELWRCAREAGIRRVVHVSVTNASETSPLPYFRTKARLERELPHCARSWAVVRPTWIFGPNDILVNNIAWGLRRLPAFPVPGDGRYRVQPVSVGDVARICIDAGSADGDVRVDAAGPDTFTFADVLGLVRDAVGCRTPIINVPPRFAVALAHVVGKARQDVLLTPEEVAGLMSNLLTSEDPPLGRDRLREWLAANATGLGRRYVSELARNYR
jgi:nucleoside-diphosphate-sugar epimerase